MLANCMSSVCRRIGVIPVHEKQSQTSLRDVRRTYKSGYSGGVYRNHLGELCDTNAIEERK